MAGIAGRGRARAVTRRRLGAAGAGGAALLAAACGAMGPGAGAGPVSARPATVRYLHVDTGQQVWQEQWGQIFANFQEKYPALQLQVDSVAFGAPAIQKAIAAAAGGRITV